MSKDTDILEEITGSEYKYGFTTNIDTEVLPPGLTEDTIRFISAKKEEPEWMLKLAKPADSGHQFSGHRILRCS